MLSLKAHNRCKILKKQRGNILVMFTIGLFSLIALAALALDGGHLLLNKSRLQNITDAAALHAARTLELGGSHALARVAAIEIIELNLDHNENFEIKESLTDLWSIDTTDVNAVIYVEFSDTADPFADSWFDEEDALYVKVKIGDVNLSNFLANILSFSKYISASALAGPSAAIEDCYNNLMPLLVCGDFDEFGDPLYSTLVDAEGNPSHAFGLPLKELYVLKIPSNTDPLLSAGNFQLIDFGTGKNTVKDMLAGADIDDTDICISPDQLLSSEPGNAAGPTKKPLDTRFGEYSGEFNGTSSEYPRDLNICQGPHITLDASGELETAADAKAYRYDQYLSDQPAVCDSVADGAVTGNIDYLEGNESGFERRILNIVIGDCTDTAVTNGKTPIPYKGTGCFFLTQNVDTGGTNSFIVGEFIKNCSIHGTPSKDAIDGNDTIVLFHVPGSTDS